MAKHIVIKDNVSPRLALLQPNIAAAMDDGVYRVASLSVQTIKRRVEAAETATGRLRASGGAPRFKPRPAWFLGRGPGRVESGAILESARWQMRTAPGKVSATAGFINAPKHLALQELGSPGARGVPPMRAFAAGHTYVAAMFGPSMRAATGKAIQAAQRGMAYRGGA